VDLYHYGDGLGFKEPGPLAAIEDFLKAHPNFEPDVAKERYRLTYNPKGYLKRIS
jgi:cephalosporin hydroxylase